MVTKGSFRRRCRLYRNSLSSTEREAKSRAVLDRVYRLSEYREARTVHTYWPIVSSKEVDTRPMIQRLLEDKRRIVLPVVDFSTRENPMLEHRELFEETELQTNRWGITEPEEGPTVPLDALEVVIVPALGADRRGHRVGYGGGFYDRFLAELSVPTIGLVYASCVTDRIDTEAHDIPLSILVTENEVLRF